MPRGKRIRARARWTDPISGVRTSRSITVDSEASAYEFFSALRSPVGANLDPFITLTNYADQIGDRFLRGVDMTSTASAYRAGFHLRALPGLGHLRIRDITTGIVDRSIDRWEIEYSRSTLKNTIAALTRVLDEAVRDEIIIRNPVRDRAHRRYRMREAPRFQVRIPSPTDVELIAAACAEAHQSYGDHIMLSAFLAARSSEVAGLIVGDVDWTSKLVTIERQYSPGAGGLSIKPPKGRRVRRVPIIEPLEPALRRLTAQRAIAAANFALHFRTAVPPDSVRETDLAELDRRLYLANLENYSAALREARHASAMLAADGLEVGESWRNDPDFERDLDTQHDRPRLRTLLATT